MIKTSDLERAIRVLEAEIDLRELEPDHGLTDELVYLYQKYVRETGNPCRLVVDESGAWHLVDGNVAMQWIGGRPKQAILFFEEIFRDIEQKEMEDKAKHTIESLFLTFQSKGDRPPECLVYDSHGWYIRYGSIVGKVHIGDDKSAAKCWLASRI